MALKIRMRQQGRSNRHAYRIVVMDVRQARDGKYLEALGWYNPLAKDEAGTLLVKPDRLQHWLDQGAEITEKAAVLASQGAPEVMRRLQEKCQAKQMKLTAKRRESRRKRAAAKKS